MAWSNLSAIDETWSGVSYADETWSGVSSVDETWTGLSPTDETWSVTASDPSRFILLNPVTDSGDGIDFELRFTNIPSFYLYDSPAANFWAEPSENP